MRYCLSLGADTSLRDKYGLGCLHATVGTADIDGNRPDTSNILSLLLDHKVDPNIQSTERGFTPLHHAADTGDFAAVKTLIDWDKDLINATDKFGKTPLWYACLHPPPDRDTIEELAGNGGCFVDGQWPELSGSRGEKINSILVKNKVSPNGG